jgi:hypothetical protein
MLSLGIDCEGSEPKVYDFDHPCAFLYKDVVELDVSMCYSIPMEIVKALSYLLEEPSTSFLGNHPVGAVDLNKMVHTYAIDEVGHDADLFLGLDQVVHSDAIRMVYLTQGDYLTLHGLTLHGVVQTSLLVNLDGEPLSRVAVVADAHHRVGPLPNELADLVFFQN